MDIFSTIENCDLPESYKVIWRLHYKERKTMRFDVRDELTWSERDYLRKKKAVKEVIVKAWRAEQE